MTRVHLTPVCLVDIASPRAAEGGVEDNGHVEEVRVDVAAAREDGSRLAKVDVGRWAPVSDAGWYLVSWEEPDINARGSPLHCIDATTIVVEASAIRGGAPVRAAASSGRIGHLEALVHGLHGSEGPLTAQLLVSSVEVCPLPEMVQSSVVWAEMRLVSPLLTPSITSTSPLFGHVPDWPRNLVIISCSSLRKK